jgi:hypothetical protein
MPNWCHNRLFVEGNREDVEAFQSQVSGGLPRGYASKESDDLRLVMLIEELGDVTMADKALQEEIEGIIEKHSPGSKRLPEIGSAFRKLLSAGLRFVPRQIFDLDEEEERLAGISQWMKEVRISAAKTDRDPTPQQQSLSLHRLAPIPDEALEYSYSYLGKDLQTSLWGTKWDVCNVEGPVTEEEGKTSRSHWVFQTAWAPPTSAILAASKRWPQLVFGMNTLFESNNGERSLFCMGIPFGHQSYEESNIPKEFRSRHSEQWTDPEGAVHEDEYENVDIRSVLVWQEEKNLANLRRPDISHLLTLNGPSKHFSLEILYEMERLPAEDRGTFLQELQSDLFSESTEPKEQETARKGQP